MTPATLSLTTSYNCFLQRFVYNIAVSCVPTRYAELTKDAEQIKMCNQSFILEFFL